MSEVQWPEVVPILDESDIYQGGWFDGPGGKTHCLVGWGCETFSEIFSGFSHHPVIDELKSEVAALKRKDLHCIVVANDRLPKKQVAAIWNRVMRKFGYTVPCER